MTMKAFYSSLQRHFAPPPVRLLQADAQVHPDSPVRLDALRAAVKAAGLSLHAPRRFDPFTAWAGVHTRRYVAFLRDGERLWQAAGLPGLPRPLMHPVQRPARRPRHIRGIAGWHMADDITPFSKGLWPVVRAAADTAITAAIAVREGEAGAAYALCRPAGRHAGPETMAGFCYVNNAALAARTLMEVHPRVALLSIGLHHAHGTQAVFWPTDRVYTVSIHVDPRHVHPYYWGYEHETGAGRGYGFNLNLPLPRGSDDDVWCGAVEYACGRIRRYRPGALVVALGLGMMRGSCPWEGEDAGRLGLAGIARAARLLKALDLPTVIVQEGGWNPETLELELTTFLTTWREGA